MPQVWPFPPLQGLSENLEWNTDIIETASVEQRIALRDLPRRSFQLRHNITELQYAAAQAYLRQDNEFYIPDWGQGFFIGSLSPGSNTSPISVPDNHFGFDLNSDVLIWESIDQFERTTIEDIDSNGNIILANVSDDYDMARLYPLLTGRSSELSVNRIGSRRAELSITMTSFSGPDLSESYYDTYRGLDVVTDCPVLSSGLSEMHSWKFVTYDAGFGSPYSVRDRSLLDVSVSMRWITKNMLETYRLRKFLYRCKGRLKAFWMSSRGEDLSLYQSIGPSDTTITVRDYPNLVALGRDASFDIDITLTDESSYYRQVSSQSEGPFGSRVLDIGTSLGASVPLSNVKRISLLRCVRFDSDLITIDHLTKSKIQVYSGLKEVDIPS